MSRGCRGTRGSCSPRGSRGSHRSMRDRRGSGPAPRSQGSEREVHGPKHVDSSSLATLRRGLRRALTARKRPAAERRGAGQAKSPCRNQSPSSVPRRWSRKIQPKLARGTLGDVVVAPHVGAVPPNGLDALRVPRQHPGCASKSAASGCGTGSNHKGRGARWQRDGGLRRGSAVAGRGPLRFARTADSGNARRALGPVIRVRRHRASPRSSPRRARRRSTSGTSRLAQRRRAAGPALCPRVGAIDSLASAKPATGAGRAIRARRSRNTSSSATAYETGAERETGQRERGIALTHQRALVRERERHLGHAEAAGEEPRGELVHEAVDGEGERLDVVHRAGSSSFAAKRGGGSNARAGRCGGRSRGRAHRRMPGRSAWRGPCAAVHGCAERVHARGGERRARVLRRSKCASESRRERCGEGVGRLDGIGAAGAAKASAACGVGAMPSRAAKPRPSTPARGARRAHRGRRRGAGSPPISATNAAAARGSSSA